MPTFSRVSHISFSARDAEASARWWAELLELTFFTASYMFGGLAFLINGNVSVTCLGASGQRGIMVRVRPDDTEKLLQREHVSVKVMGGREPRGWLHVATDGLKTKRQLQSWVTRGVEYAKTLRPK